MLNVVCHYYPSLSSGIDKAPSRRVTYEASVCNVVLHVHVKQDCAPGKGMFLSKKTKVQHRVTVMMPFRDTSGTEKYAIIFVTNQICIKLP